jgi:hypothetical protein
MNSAGAPESIVPIDPLDFPVSGMTGFPHTLYARVGSDSVPLRCHVIPPKSSGPQFRLYGKDGAEFQGFFVYRADRLLQVGGWNGLIRKTATKALARVVVDDFESLRPHIRMNPEKDGIIFAPQLGAAISQATAGPGDGPANTFADFIAQAEHVLAESKRRIHARRPVAEPAKGFHEEVRKVIRSEIPIRTNEEPVQIRWRTMLEGKFLELEREARTIYLNQHYREVLTGGRTGLSDAPLLKTLVFLLTEQHFTGQYWGSRDKDLIDMWDAVLGVAVQVESDYRSRGRSPS